MTTPEARASGKQWIAAGGGCPLGALGLWQQDAEEPWPQRVTETDPGPSGCRLVGIDLHDPATKGAALDVVRERWGAPYAQVTPWLRMRPTVTCSGWRVCLNDADDQTFRGATEAEALVAALEAAPAVVC